MPVMSVAGVGRKELVYDFKNAKHVVLQTRNIFEAINVQEVNNLMEALDERLQADGHRHPRHDLGRQGRPLHAGPARHRLCLQPGGDP